MSDKTFTMAEILAALPSWEAWSATNLIYNLAGELLLGSRAEPGTSIPEPGDIALIGGFNNVLPGPAMRAAVADEHARIQANLILRRQQCSAFMPCEYDMAEIEKPLKTALGPLPIKRTAYDRIVLIDNQQQPMVKVGGDKLKELIWYSRERFEDEISSGRISFPYQLEHVRLGFIIAGECVDVREVPKLVSWVHNID